jgi:protein-S-isoprenylcysteine O-methyltransferase Ste14
MATIAVPLAVCVTGGVDPGWGLPGPLAAAAVAAGAALAGLGVWLVARTIGLFSRRGEGTLAPWDETRNLVAAGPYRHVRNPMITGVFIILTGETLASGTPGMAVWTGVFGALNAIYMPLVEEPRLARRFGKNYVDYKRNVPRWIPRRTPWAPVLAIALAWLALGAGPARAESAIEAAPALSSAGEPASAWTAERMRSAEPLAPPTAPGEEAAPAGPGPLARAADQQIDPARDTQYPERTHGRLFLRLGGEDASCSGTVVTSRTRNVVLTAAHCLVAPTQSGPVWATDVVFAPAYRDGATPLGTYTATVLRAPELWSFEGVIELDVGAVTLAPGAAGPIEDALGARGVSFNRPPKRYKANKTAFSLFGYPALPDPPYDGELPILCKSTFKGFELFTGSPVAGPCNMKQGSSGGGWVLKGGLVNSVISHNACGTDPDCKVISGTYFGNTALSLWKKAGGGIAKKRQKKIKKCKKKPKKGGKRADCIWKAEEFKPTKG